uniref:Nicotinate phosphoribosyltransferase n=1 Tax=Lygus hesperus TaxID=30085 RepID=A0A0A9WQR7_LYGHE
MEPIIKEENVVIRLKISKFLRSEDNVDEVILSRFNNSINELVNGRVICHIRLQNPVDNAHQLKLFYSYEPKFKHYIFMNGSDLFIVRKLNDSLVHHKMYSNVLNFTIEDHLNLGKPQVIVNLLSSEPPIITDCNDENHLSKPDHKLIQSFATLVQKSKLRIENAERILKEKTRILSKLSSTLAFNCDDDAILTTSDRLVYLKESLANGDVGLPAKGKALSVGGPWFRTHSNKWIVGFPVMNVSKRDMSAFEMYVSHENIIIKRTLLFTNSESSSASNVYQESGILYEGKSGHLVAVLEEPHFIAKSFVLRCVCCFEHSPCESEQCYLGQMEIITSDLAGDKYRMPPVTSSTQDIIAIQSSSKSSELSYQLLNITREQFMDTVETVFKLKKIARNVMINTMTYANSPRLLIFFDDYSESFVSYTDTSNDFLLLLHKLMDVFRGSVLFGHPNSHPARALEAMKKEMLYVKELLVNELVESDSNSKPSVKLEDAFREMMLLEIDSANEINLLKQYSLQ